MPNPKESPQPSFNKLQKEEDLPLLKSRLKFLWWRYLPQLDSSSSRRL